jgi:hypothetical protein
MVCLNNLFFRLYISLNTALYSAGEATQVEVTDVTVGADRGTNDYVYVSFNSSSTAGITSIQFRGYVAVMDDICYNVWEPAASSPTIRFSSSSSFIAPGIWVSIVGYYVLSNF